MIPAETLAMTDAEHEARLNEMKRRVDTAEENCRSAVAAMRIAMEQKDKAETLAQDRLYGLLAAASFSSMLLRELQRLTDKKDGSTPEPGPNDGLIP